MALQGLMVHLAISQSENNRERFYAITGKHSQLTGKASRSFPVILTERGVLFPLPAAIKTYTAAPFATRSSHASCACHDNGMFGVQKMAEAKARRLLAANNCPHESGAQECEV